MCLLDRVSSPILRATKSADYLLPEEEEDGGRKEFSWSWRSHEGHQLRITTLGRRGEEDSALVKIDLPTSLKAIGCAKY